MGDRREQIYYPTKIPDLIGIRDRKFFDHTAKREARRKITDAVVDGASQRWKALGTITAGWVPDNLG